MGFLIFLIIISLLYGAFFLFKELKNLHTLAGFTPFTVNLHLNVLEILKKAGLSDDDLESICKSLGFSKKDWDLWTCHEEFSEKIWSDKFPKYKLNYYYNSPISWTYLRTLRCYANGNEYLMFDNDSRGYFSSIQRRIDLQTPPHTGLNLGKKLKFGCLYIREIYIPNAGKWIEIGLLKSQSVDFWEQNFHKSENFEVLGIIPYSLIDENIVKKHDKKNAEILKKYSFTSKYEGLGGSAISNECMTVSYWSL